MAYFDDVHFMCIPGTLKYASLKYFISLFFYCHNPDKQTFTELLHIQTTVPGFEPCTLLVK